jgi:hypothetical protein
VTELNSAAKLCGSACAAVEHCILCPAYEPPQPEKRKRGRPPNRYAGLTLRDLGMTRKDAWECRRMAEIPKDQFEALLKAPRVHGRRLGTLGMLRAAGKLAPEKPRPPERARAEAIDYLEFVQEQLGRLQRELLETGSESEIAHANESAAAVNAALNTLRRVTPSRSEP